MSTKGIRISFESASASIKEVNGEHMLVNVYARDRGKGHASGLMDRVIYYADKNQLRLKLIARPYKTVARGDVLSPEALVEFYRKYGFVTDYTRDGAEYMVRPAGSRDLRPL